MNVCVCMCVSMSTYCYPPVFQSMAPVQTRHLGPDYWSADGCHYRRCFLKPMPAGQWLEASRLSVRLWRPLTPLQCVIGVLGSLLGAFPVKIEKAWLH